MLFSVLLIPTLTSLLFFSNATPTTEIYTLSLHDALPISGRCRRRRGTCRRGSTGTATRSRRTAPRARPPRSIDRKRTRLNSSHTVISYAVFCLKKKKKSKVVGNDRKVSSKESDTALTRQN